MCNKFRNEQREACLKCGDMGRCEPRTLADPDGQECDCISIVPIDKILSADEYVKKRWNLGNSVLQIAESYANLRVEQAKQEWKIEREELISIAKTGLPSECVENWSEVKFCSIRNGEGGKCKWCFGLFQS